MTHLWTRRPTILEPRRELALTTGLQGWYKIEAGKRDGRRRLLADWFPNLITNSGLNALGGVNEYTAYWARYCFVGSGTNSPSPGDNSMQTLVAGTTTLQARTNFIEPTEPHHAELTTTYRFAEGVAAGNLSEVGIGDGTVDSVDHLFSRSRILDAEGNPTTITVLGDEFLDVTYQLRLYPPMTDLHGTVDLGGSDLVFDYTLRVAQITSLQQWGIALSTTISGTQRWNGSYMPVRQNPNEQDSYSGDIGPMTGEPTGNILGNAARANTVTPATYIPDSFHWDSAVIWGLNNGNHATGMRSVVIRVGRRDVASSPAAMGSYQIQFDPVIPKTEAKILTLNFRTAWARKAL